MLVVLGGSSPWTIRLLQQMRRGGIALVGRDEDALRALRRFARAQGSALDIELSTDAESVLPHASAVLCQARIGGWQGRAADEGEARRWNAYGDETLGIGGLRSALRSMPAIAAWAQAAGQVPALMFSNPTDLLARVWNAYRPGTCTSVCEIPTLLTRDLPRSEYLGVNHTGYAMLPSGGWRPTRWSAMAPELPRHIARQRASLPRRAAAVHELGTSLRSALAAGDTLAVERLLRRREPMWYELLIVPLIEHLLHDRQFRGIVGRPNSARLADVDPDVIVESRCSNLVPDPLSVPDELRRSVARFARGRDRAWRYMTSPSEASLRSYLEADPFAQGAACTPELLAWVQGAVTAARPAPRSC